MRTARLDHFQPDCAGRKWSISLFNRMIHAPGTFRSARSCSIAPLGDLPHEPSAESRGFGKAVPPGATGRPPRAVLNLLYLRPPTRDCPVPEETLRRSIDRIGEGFVTPDGIREPSPTRTFGQAPPVAAHGGNPTVRFRMKIARNEPSLEPRLPDGNSTQADLPSEQGVRRSRTPASSAIIARPRWGYRKPQSDGANSSRLRHCRASQPGRDGLAHRVAEIRATARGCPAGAPAIRGQRP
jgi:hypothetical protein